MASGSGNRGISSAESCGICRESLILPSRDDPDTPFAIIDDVQLLCGHHFHWSCIMEYAKANQDGREKCTVCRASVLTPSGKFIVSVRNEGGFTGGFDLGEEIDEEAYMDAHPEVRRKEAFLALMQDQQFEAAEEMLRGEDEGADGVKMDPNAAYDEGGLTAMHFAAYNNDVPAIELLLRYGADKNFRSDDGSTALDCARETKSEEVIAFLSG